MKTFARILLVVAIGLAALSSIFLQGGGPASVGPDTEQRFPPVKVPAGFKATLFACDPLIEYPSVISIGPKPGAIFVAIDYMTGLGTDGKVKSEVRLVEDTNGDGYADRATVFAKGFNSIQGLAYHDGVVYVMHAPFLTALRDTKKTGIADERKDLLTGLGLKPEDNSSRLHCANGVVVGHDGWLYLAVGDNGVNVPRPEGDRLVFNGGGILRCRPDGRDLHSFSTGLRNIYDIALDAELNVFTRDNENDGGTYMIRVCHSFFGADHGYPYDYYERPDHAMKPIGDFSLGSSAGGVCYLETQFPPEYCGNLFFCEWGKSVVRYPLKQAGSSFAPVKEIEFLSGDSKDTYPFKPTDVVVQRDGTLMIADYADGQRPKRGRGRIYHVRYVGQDSEPVKKKPKSDLEKLNSESYFERCEAQAAYERRGDVGRNDLGDALRANKIGPLGIGHALLALSKGKEGTGLGDMLVMAGDGVPPGVRARAMRIIGDFTDPILVKHKLDAGRGDVEIARFLATLKDRDDPRIMLEIVIALGRLRWADAPEWLTTNVTKPDDAPALAQAAMQTLRRADNWPAVLKILDQSGNLAMRTIALRALSDRHESAVVDGLIERLGETKEAEHRRQYAALLMRVYKKPAPWKYWGYRPGPRPANTERWERTEAIEKALDRWLTNDSHTERVVILKRMEREKVPVRLATLTQWLKVEKDIATTAALLTALPAQLTPEVRDALDSIVRRELGPANRLTALTILMQEANANEPAILAKYAALLEDGDTLAAILRRLGAYPKYTEAGAVVASRLKSFDPRVRAAVIEALGELRATEGRESALQAIQDKDVRVRRAAIGAVGKLNVKPAVEQLLKLLADADIETRVACFDALRRLREPRVVPLAVKAMNDRDVGLMAFQCIAELGETKHAHLVADFAKRSPSAEVLTIAVTALTRWKDSEIVMMDLAVAELHATGVLVRWQTGPAMPADAAVGVLARFGRPLSIPGADWHTLFATDSESRLMLTPQQDLAKPVRFAFTDIAVPAEMPVEFLASARGNFEVWLNGKSIHRRAQPGKYQIDSDRFLGSFDKGVNRLLVQTGGDSPLEFHLRFRRKSAKVEHEKRTQAALSRPGNAERGRTVFFDKNKSQCINCHRMGDQGERIGPELTAVGARFSRIYLIDSILEPSRTIAPSFGTLTVALKNGKTLNGVKLTETETTITLADNQGHKHVVLRGNIDEQHPSAISSMPEGLEQRLTEAEFVDLIAFLASQK